MQTNDAGQGGTALELVRQTDTVLRCTQRAMTAADFLLTSDSSARAIEELDHVAAHLRDMLVRIEKARALIPGADSTPVRSPCENLGMGPKA